MKSEVMQAHIAAYLNGLCEPKYEAIKTYAEEQTVPSVSPLTGELLNLLVKIQSPKTVLELGCGIGMSTQYLLDSDLQYLDSVDLNEKRIQQAALFAEDDSRVRFHHLSVEDYLTNCQHTYDFVFVDTIKKDYLNVWYLLKPLLNSNAVIVFDDVLLYGYVANMDCEIPMKYRNGVNELRNFIAEIMADKSVKPYVLPVTDGILVVRYEG